MAEKIPDSYPMRINKYLARKGFSTRRGADELIEKKRVILNGRLAVLGDKVSETDIVELRPGVGKNKIKNVYYAYYKPIGIVSHSPQKGERDVVEATGLKDVFPIGRLDKNSEGLMILTNDGRITDRLLNPEHTHEKEYLIETLTKLRPSFAMHMEKGVDIGDKTPEMTKPCKVKVLGDNKFSIIITEGKKHQIRRMCSALHVEVENLKRVRIMGMKLGKLNQGQYRPIEGDELEMFLKSLGL